jgi:putative chitinase
MSVVSFKGLRAFSAGGIRQLRDYFVVPVYIASSTSASQISRVVPSKSQEMPQQVKIMNEPLPTAEDKCKITIELLKKFAPNGKNLEEHAKALEAARQSSTIRTPKRLAAFLGQVHVETGGFATIIESGIYSFDRFMKIRGSQDGFINLNRLKDKPIDPNGILKKKLKNGSEVDWKDRYEQKAAELSSLGQKEQLNFLYAGKNGNQKDPSSGDGFNFRGRGYLQITGRKSYKDFGDAAGIDLLKDPAQMDSFSFAARVSMAYWDNNKISEPADRWDLKAVTGKINTGFVHYDDEKDKQGNTIPGRKTLSNIALNLIDPSADKKPTI